MIDWLRSFLFQAYFYLSTVPYGLAAIVVSPWPRASYACAAAWGAAMLGGAKYICGLDYVLEGRENIPDRPCVVLIKHTSVWEIYAQLVLFPRQCWVMKQELLAIPFFGWGLRALKPIAIDRSAGGSAVKQVIRQGKERLAEDIWVVVFPEGTRVPPGTTRKYGISGAALAHETGVPVVPVAHNAGDFWPRRSLLKKPGLIRLRVGAPIDGGAQPPKETNAIVQDWVEATMREISSGYGDGPPVGN